MRILVLVTYTADCEKNWLSLMAAGHTVTVETYDNRPHDRQIEIIEKAKRLQPHAIVYIGAIEKYHGRPVLTVETLQRLRGIAPTIHICGDGSDKAWWENLETYDAAACFATQVSIDGNHATPIASFKNGLVKLTPTDPGLFEPLPAWEARPIKAATTGGRGHGERAAMIDALMTGQHATWFDSSAGQSYASMCRFMSTCRVIVNSPMNGTGDGDHVKGRVIETGFAGACLFERKNPITSKWFRPGEDYVEYDDPGDATKQLAWAVENDEIIRAVANRFRIKVIAEHHPRVFWRDVFQLVGAEHAPAD